MNPWRELIVTDMSWPRLGATRQRVRARAATTPGRLRLTMAAIVLVALLAGLVLGALTALRRSAADAVATRDEPVMVGAERLYRALSDADATAATTYLRGGAEPAALRARYLADLRTGKPSARRPRAPSRGIGRGRRGRRDRRRPAGVQRSHGDCSRQQPAGLPGSGRRVRAPGIRRRHA